MTRSKRRVAGRRAAVLVGAIWLTGCAAPLERAAPFKVRDVLVARMVGPAGPAERPRRDAAYAALERRAFSLQPVMLHAGLYCTERARRLYDLPEGPMVRSRYALGGQDASTDLRVLVTAFGQTLTVEILEPEDYRDADRFTRTEAERKALHDLLEELDDYIRARYPEESVSIDLYRDREKLRDGRPGAG